MKVLELKKVIAVLVVITISIYLLSSCCSNTDKNTTAASRTTSVQKNASTAANKNSSEPGKPTEIGMFINFSWYPMKDWTGPISEEITKKTGVKLKFTIASDDNQLPILIASGNLPEMIFTDYNNIKRLSNPKLCYSWNELIEKYAPDFKIDKAQSALYTMSDGKFYTMLDNFATKEEWNAAKYAMPIGPGLCFRKDLMEKLNSPQINTLDDLDKVLGMAKERFPGVTPLIMNTDCEGNYIASQYGLATNPGFIIDSQGKIVYYIKQQGRLDYYKTMNMYYRKGYIIPENYVYKDEDESYKMAIDGKCFAYMKLNGTADELNVKTAAAGTNYQFTQAVKPISNKAAYYNTGIGSAGVFITRNNKHPKESINLLKFLRSEEGQRVSYWGKEGKYWTMNPKGYPEFKVNTDDEAVLKRTGMKWFGLFANSAITEGLFNYNPNQKQTTQAAIEIKNRTIYQPVLGSLIPDVGTQENLIKSKLDDMIKNEEVKIYLAKSEEDCVKAYDNLLENAEQMGESTLEDWANSKYREVQALSK